MIRYPHTTPWMPAIGIAAAFATVATLGLAIVLPASLGVDAVARDARPAEVTVTLERLDIAAHPVVAVDKAALPVGYAPAKQRS